MPADVDPELYRQVMAGFPSGVTVVTATDSGGRPVGLTVSAFCAVSLQPPLILACVDNGSNTLPVIERTGRFAVNILAHGRSELAKRFASKEEDKFTGVEHAPGPYGPILVADAAAHIGCTVHAQLPAGDHQVFLGRVHEGAVLHERPLVYHLRGFAGLGSL
jgi:flavin reductase (DIM6/NTAB) family NADH-FMN oxidoreductase RutF